MVEVRTSLDKVALLKLNQFHMYRKNIFTILIPMIIFTALGLAMFFFPNEESDKYVGIIYSVTFGFGFPLLCYGMMRFMLWLQLRSAKYISNETIIDYKFENDIIYYNMEKSGMKTTSEFAWYLCYKAYETKDYFYVYISNMQAHIVPKKDITHGTSQELSEILRDKVKKFKQFK